jgi:hypothetical protein
LANLNSKILLAPVLALVLALLLAGAVSMWPHDPQSANPQSTPAPTPYGYTPMPVQAPSAADLYFLPTMLLFPFIIIILAIFLLYFRKEPR